MEWLNIESVEELKQLGTMRKVIRMIKKDMADLFKDKESRDKNIVSMIEVKSNSWQGLYQKIVALREVITYIDGNFIINKNIDNLKEEGRDEGYFNSKESEYIFYLLELDGKQRADKLNITMKCYSSKKEAKLWRDSIAKIIHPDKCNNSRANEAICKLNQLYEDMLSVR